MSPKRRTFLSLVFACICISKSLLIKAVSERLKLHGRWKTDEAKDIYVLESESNRLSLTKYLGI